MQTSTGKTLSLNFVSGWARKMIRAIGNRFIEREIIESFGIKGWLQMEKFSWKCWKQSRTFNSVCKPPGNVFNWRTLNLFLQLSMINTPVVRSATGGNGKLLLGVTLGCFREGNIVIKCFEINAGECLNF